MRKGKTNAPSAKQEHFVPSQTGPGQLVVKFALERNFPLLKFSSCRLQIEWKDRFRRKLNFGSIDELESWRLSRYKLMLNVLRFLSFQFKNFEIIGLNVFYP